MFQHSEAKCISYSVKTTNEWCLDRFLAGTISCVAIVLDYAYVHKQHSGNNRSTSPMSSGPLEAALGSFSANTHTQHNHTCKPQCAGLAGNNNNNIVICQVHKSQQ